MPLFPKLIEFKVETFGFDQVKQYLTRLRPKHMGLIRQEYWQWGEELIFIAEVLSPKDKLRGKDWRRRPKQESFAKQWRWQMETQGPKSLELQVGNVDPIAGWIIEGTRPRRIEAYDWSHPMYFYWEKGYAGEGFYTGWVILGGVAEKGTPEHPVHIQTLENFDVHAHIARLASRL